MDFKANIPIYFQVIEDIKKNIITGSLPLGSKLPSSRELALQFQINPNTAARVYNEMEAMGLSFTRRGIGTFVTEDQGVIEKLKKEQIDKILKDFDEQTAALGFSHEEVIALLKNYYNFKGGTKK